MQKDALERINYKISLQKKTQSRGYGRRLPPSPNGGRVGEDSTGFLGNLEVGNQH